MKRNGIISFWKFLYAVMIVLFHGNLLADKGNKIVALGGYIGVEFFFIVSGVFLASSIIKIWDNDNSNLGKDTIKFIWKKFCAFFPYVLVAYLAIFILYIKVNNLPIHRLLSSIWGLFLLQETGIRSLPLNTPTWYLSSMLLCMFIIYPLMRKHKMNYVYFIAPIIVLLGIGIMSHTIDGLNHIDTWMGFTYHANIRAFTELNLGILIYFISKKLKEIKFTKFGRFCLTLVEIGCLSIPFLVTTFISKSYRYDYLMLVFIALGILIAMANITLESNLLDNKIVHYFEKLSLPLYIFHGFVLKTVIETIKLFKLNLSYANKLAIYLLSSIVLAAFMLKVIEYFRNKNFYLDKMKKLFISE